MTVINSRWRTIANNSLRSLGVHDVREMRVEDALLLVVFAMHLQEVGAEIFDDSVVVVFAVAEGWDAVIY